LTLKETTMRRSEVNKIIADAKSFMGSFGFILPPFAHYSPFELKASSRECPTILTSRLGWDITDFGEGRFNEYGLVLLTTRNGNPTDLAKGKGMVYAEKLMISRAKQYSPMHRHNIKGEDIINRGGGKLVFELFMSKDDGSIDEKAEVRVLTDARERRLPAGGKLSLSPGESLTLLPGVWHAFWGEEKDVLIGEVSCVNDDINDNVFRDPIGRFSKIEEDMAPQHLLVSDYDEWLK
jgi:D-lyxose ketol-isomerase